MPELNIGQTSRHAPQNTKVGNSFVNLSYFFFQIETNTLFGGIFVLELKTPPSHLKPNSMKYIIIHLCILASCTLAYAQNAKPTITFYSIDENSEVTMTEGESSTCQAPLEITCQAYIEPLDGYTHQAEWKFFDTSVGESEIILTRYEENTSYTLTNSGSYGIKLYVTFANERDTIEYESEQMTITISESSFSCPNAFSPNGDGINDVFKFTHKSIVKFEAVIFNRWGQKLRSLGMNDIDTGWDGRQGGDYVKDGVYFININAVGADGVKYEIKKAINVLKGFKETEETPGA